MEFKPIAESVEDFLLFLQEHKTYTISSEPKKLRWISCLLYTIAGAGVNPSHISSYFSRYSLFKGLVSHGSAVIAKGEGNFLKLFQFTKPVEFISFGMNNVNYLTPIRLGDVYFYEYTISNLRKDRKMWKFDCHIVCKVGDNIVAQWDWFVGAVEKVVSNYEFYDDLVWRPESSMLSQLFGLFIGRKYWFQEMLAWLFFVGIPCSVILFLWKVMGISFVTVNGEVPWITF